MYCVAISFLLAFVAQMAHSEPSIDSRPICTSGKLDLVLVIDVAGSNEQRFMTNRDLAWDMAHSMPISSEKCLIAVVQYSRLATTKIEFYQSQSWADVNDTLFNLQWTGDVTLTAEAMDLAMIQFRRSRPDAQRAIVLFTQGNSYNKWGEVLATADRLKYSEAKIHAVAMGGPSYDTELKVYVNASNGTIVHRQDEFEQLKRELLGYTVASCRAAPQSRASSHKRVPPSSKPTSSEETGSLFKEDQTTSTSTFVPPVDANQQESTLSTFKARNSTRARSRSSRKITKTTRARTSTTTGSTLSTTKLPTLPPAGAPEKFIDRQKKQ